MTIEEFTGKYPDRSIDIANRRDLRSDAMFVFRAMSDSMALKDARIAELEAQADADVEEISILEFEINRRKPQFEVGDVVEVKASQSGFRWIVIRNDALRVQSTEAGGGFYFNLPEDVKLSKPVELTADQKLRAMANELRKCTFGRIPQLEAIIEKYLPKGEEE